MTLPEHVVTGLEDLLKDCTARITQPDGGRPAGAGFFVSDTLVMTAGHVVGDHVDGQVRQVAVQRFGGAAVLGEVLPPSEIAPDLDIALVRVPSDPSAPAVVLSRQVDDGAFSFSGYPREDFFTNMNAGLELGRAQGRANRDNATKKLQALRLTDVQIKPGFSGGPILSGTNGAVVAVTIYTEDQTAALGGGAETVERAVEAYPELALLAAQPPAAASRWREILERPNWEALGFAWDPDRQVDIHLTGDRSRWNIGVGSSDAGSDLTFRDLGDDMSEVLVRWARSSGRRDESEVRLLGRLLSAAIFPPAVVAGLPPAAARGEDPVLVRLHVDPNGPLADLPWEFVTHPVASERFLAATDGYAFVRVNPVAGAAPTRNTTRSPADPVRVLTVVVQPEDTTRWSPVVDMQQLIPWPSGADITEGLRASISGQVAPDGQPAFTLEQLSNPALTDFNDRAAGPPVDIVHYVGFAYQSPDPSGALPGPERTMMAFSRGSSGVSDLRYYPASDVLSAIARLNPALVVLEFGTPSFDDPYEKWGQGCEPVGPSMLSASGDLAVDALVCTRPVHPYQCQIFNGALYKRLAAGQSVEQAVQLARQALLTERAIDFAGFGWFMAATGSVTRARYFEESPLVDARGPGAVSPSRTDATTGAGPAAGAGTKERRDGFGS